MSDTRTPLPDCRIRPATRADAGTIGALVHRLLAGIMAPGQVPPADVLAEAARRLFDEGPGFAAYLAEEADGRPAGLLTLTELGAVFARGRFGEVAELGVEPGWRSRQLGARLVETAVAHGRRVGWTRLELTAPHAEDAPDASRAWAFYRRLGFLEAGPRMKVKL
ncbi:MAG: GNAT family N-acetyltransferase [Tistlia sp.]